MGRKHRDSVCRESAWTGVQIPPLPQSSWEALHKVCHLCHFPHGEAYLQMTCAKCLTHSPLATNRDFSPRSSAVNLSPGVLSEEPHVGPRRRHSAPPPGQWGPKKKEEKTGK